jgi:hypothetical protein
MIIPSSEALKIVRYCSSLLRSSWLARVRSISVTTRAEKIFSIDSNSPGLAIGLRDSTEMIPIELPCTSLSGRPA